jgi:hypothetical protein
MSRWDIFEAIAKKTLISTDEEKKTLWARITDPKKERWDKNLPNGIKLNARVELPLLEMNYGNSLKGFNMVQPFTKGTITAIGRMDIGGGLSLYRAYMSSDDSNDVNQVIQFEMIEDSENFTSYIYTKGETVYPQNDDEWDFWLNDDNGAIGNDTITAPNGAVYYRVLQATNNGHVHPVETDEIISTDIYDGNTSTVKHTMMIYSRILSNDIVEYLMVSAAQEDDTQIEFLFGVEVITDIKIY